MLTIKWRERSKARTLEREKKKTLSRFHAFVHSRFHPYITTFKINTILTIYEDPCSRHELCLSQ